MPGLENDFIFAQRPRPVTVTFHSTIDSTKEGTDREASSIGVFRSGSSAGSTGLSVPNSLLCVPRLSVSVQPCSSMAKSSGNVNASLASVTSELVTSTASPPETGLSSTLSLPRKPFAVDRNAGAFHRFGKIGNHHVRQFDRRRQFGVFRIFGHHRADFLALRTALERQRPTFFAGGQIARELEHQLEAVISAGAISTAVPLGRGVRAILSLPRKPLPWIVTLAPFIDSLESQDHDAGQLDRSRQIRVSRRRSSSLHEVGSEPHRND